MPQKNAPREAGVLDPQTQRIALTLPVLLSLIGTIVVGAIYVVRLLDGALARIAEHDAILRRSWTLDDQREWTHEFQQTATGVVLPDPDKIKEKLKK